MFLVTVIYLIHWRWIDPFLFLATHALKYKMKSELNQLLRASQQLKSKFCSLLSPWASGLQFHASSEITLLSSHSRGTGGYRSAPDIPLKPPFSLSAPVTRLIVRDCRDKALRVFFRFPPD